MNAETTVAPALHCVHAAECGGCPAIAQSYELQCASKQRRVEGALAHFSVLDPSRILSLRGAEQRDHYRTRAKLVVGADGAIGLYARGGEHRVLDIPQCQVLAPVVERAVAALRAIVKDERSPRALRAANDGGALRAIDVREIGDEGAASVMVSIVVDRHAKLSDSELANACAIVERDCAARSVAVSTHDGRSALVLGSGLRVFAGEDAPCDRIGASPVFQRCPHGSFVQTHRAQAATAYALVDEALSSLARNASVLELYSGTGAIGLSLAERGHRVTMVESFPPSSKRCAEAAREQSLRVECVAGDAAEVTTRLVAEKRRFDAVVLDPPRRGCDASVREAIAAVGARLVVYVSCDPETMARDAAHLVRLGYRAVKCTPLDMMPHTEEVESVLVLERAEVPSLAVVHEEATLLVIDKPAHLRTTGAASEPSTLAMVRAREGWSQAVAIARLEAPASGLCAFAIDASRAQRWRTVDEQPQYTALVKGVTHKAGTVTRSATDEAPASKSKLRRERVVGGHSLVSVHVEPDAPGTLRQALASIGHPVLGDERFGDGPSNTFMRERFALDRAFVHRASLTLESDGARATWSSPLPPELTLTLARLSTR